MPPPSGLRSRAVDEPVRPAYPEHFVTRHWLSSRARAALLLCALLFGPIGPGGAWHVARVDDAAGAASASARVGDPAPCGSTGHQGPTCTVCQLLHGLRGVLSASAALAAGSLSSVSCTIEFRAILRTGQRLPCAGRAPPTA